MSEWIFVFSLLIATSTITRAVDLSDYILPTTTIPSRYILNLTVLRTALETNQTSFSGTVNITFEVTETKNIILIHSAVSDISDISLTDSNGSLINISSTSLNSTTKILTLVLNSSLVSLTDYYLKLDFTSELNTENTDGFFRVTYTSNGTTEFIAGTLFEDTFARSAFPCFDEPQYKATFTLSLTHPSDYVAWSNALVVDRMDSNDTVTTTFKATPIMSSYLLAFSISKFTCSYTYGLYTNITYGVCTKTGFAESRDLALEYGSKFVDVMSNWTNYEYTASFGKLDQIGVPTFGGGMENWGFIFYGEDSLLWDDDSSEYYREAVIITIAHEVAHQWFGNLVTTKWWDTLFLNEGFANYLQYLLPNLVGLEDWEMQKRFALEQHQYAFRADASVNSVALNSEVWTQEQITSKFSTTTYGKGAVLFKLIENIIGMENFQSAIQLYIQEYKYTGAKPDQLWEIISNYVPDGSLPKNQNFSEIIYNYVNKAGFPLINVTVSGNDVTLTQNRFLTDGTDDTQWYVPITYFTSDNETIIKTWLVPNSTLNLSNILTNTSWIIVNPDSYAYFRVNYDSDLRGRIISTFLSNYSKISDVNRAQILDDILVLSQYGYLNYSEVFELMEYLTNETSYYPIMTSIKGLYEIIYSVDQDLVDLIRKDIVRWIEHLATNIADQDWESTDHITAILMNQIWSQACDAGYRKTINETVKLLKNFRVNGTSINPNVRFTVYCNALRYTDELEADYNFLSNRSKTIDHVQENLELRNALTYCAPTADLLKSHLEQSISMPTQDFSKIWSLVYYKSQNGVDVAFNVFKNNHSKIFKKHKGKALSTFQEIIKKFTRNSQIEKLEEFMVELEDDSKLKQSVELALNSIKKDLKRKLKIKTELRRHFGLSN